MRQRIKRTRAILFAALLLCTTLWLPAMGGYFNSAANGHVCDHGYYTFGDKKLYHGVGTYEPYPILGFWINSALTNTSASETQFNYEDLIALAAMDWRDNTKSSVGVETPINLRYMAKRLEANIEFWKSTDLRPGVLGQTQHYKATSHLIELNADGSLKDHYMWSKIELNTDLLNSGYSKNKTQRKVTIAHELGHAFGLSHRNNAPSSIMCQYLGGTRTATYPSYSDCMAINHLYPEPKNPT